MCGIVGYVGRVRPSTSCCRVFPARVPGYDSAGVALVRSDSMDVIKTV